MNDISLFHFCCIFAAAVLLLCAWDVLCEWSASWNQKRRRAQLRAERAAKHQRDAAHHAVNQRKGVRPVKLAVSHSSEGGDA